MAFSRRAFAAAPPQDESECNCELDIVDVTGISDSGFCSEINWERSLSSVGRHVSILFFSLTGFPFGICLSASLALPDETGTLLISALDTFSPSPNKPLKQPDNIIEGRRVRQRTIHTLLMKMIRMMAQKLSHLNPFVNLHRNNFNSIQ